MQSANEIGLIIRTEDDFATQCVGAAKSITVAAPEEFASTLEYVGRVLPRATADALNALQDLDELESVVLALTGIRERLQHIQRVVVLAFGRHGIHPQSDLDAVTKFNKTIEYAIGLVWESLQRELSFYTE